MEVLRRCPLAIAQRLVHCAIALSTAVLDRVIRQCPLHRCWRTTWTTRSKRRPTCSAQRHPPTHDIFWALLRVQLHLPPLRSLNLLISPGALGTLPAQHTTFNTLDNWAINPPPNQKGKGPERKGHRVMARNMYTIHSVTYENCIPRNIWLQFFTPFQATIWHTVVVYKNVVIEPCTLWCRVDCTQRDIYLICHIITNKYRRLLNILLYWIGATIKSQEINRHAKLCIKFCKSAKLPIFFYKMSNTVHSIVNPLCVFDHLVSDHHILVIENRFRKKLRCRVWFHFTTENSISFEDVWPEGIIFDSLVEKAGAVAL